MCILVVIKPLISLVNALGNLKWVLLMRLKGYYNAEQYIGGSLVSSVHELVRTGGGFSLYARA